MDQLSSLTSAGESNPLCNKEEEVDGCYHPFPRCFGLHISDFDLLVDQIGNVVVVILYMVMVELS